MGLLSGKKILICGLLSERSIAYGIARAVWREGGELALTYAAEPLKERVTKLAEQFNARIVLPCDLCVDAQISAVADYIQAQWGELDGLVHSVAFAPREALNGDYLDVLTREAFCLAHDVSSYSFSALAKALRPLFKDHASLLTLSYLGAVRAVPNYNVMGLAKASLEANVRYMALALGRKKQIRVNSVSSGPIKTLAAAGIGNFTTLSKGVADAAPLGRGVTLDDLGNTAVFLLSDWARAITGQTVYVDAGFSIACALPSSLHDC